MKYMHWYDWETSEEHLNIRDAMDEVKSLRESVEKEKDDNKEEFDNAIMDCEEAQDRLSDIYIHLERISEKQSDEVDLKLDTSISVNGFSVDIDVDVAVSLDTVASKLGVDHDFHKAHDLANY